MHCLYMELLKYLFNYTKYKSSINAILKIVHVKFLIYSYCVINIYKLQLILNS